MAAAAAAATSLLLRLHQPRHPAALPLLLRAAISSSRALLQQPELSPASPDPAAVPGSAPLPPKPSSGSPFYGDNWRNPAAANPSSSSSLLPAVVAAGPFDAHSLAAVYSANPGAAELKETFAEWMAEQRWEEMKQLFEFWVRSLDAATGKPNRPDVDLFNSYLRANLMSGATPVEMLDLAEQTREFDITPNTASHNLVLKSMVQAQEAEGAEKLIERSGRLDSLTSVIEKCKATDKNKVLCPQWSWCTEIAEAAFEANNSKLALFALEFLARWIACSEHVTPLHLSVDEGLLISALSTAGRTYSTDLLNAAWSILRKSLCQKRAPTPEAYIAKIYAHSSIGQLQRAFGTLREFENTYGNSKDIGLELFSSFTSLRPLVVACCKDGFTTLDLTEEACNVFQHLVSLGVKPNATTYSLVDTHLVNRDPKAALVLIDEMIDAGFTPSKETLKKVRRHSSRESDFDSDEKVQSLCDSNDAGA
ncbi:hypothetical protein ABZP36_000544 [Zizania latifolia]